MQKGRKKINDTLLNIGLSMKESPLFHIVLAISFIFSLITLFMLPSVLRERAVERSVVKIINSYEDVNSISYGNELGSLTPLTSDELIVYKPQLQPGKILSAQKEEIIGQVDSHFITFHFYINEELLFSTEIYSLTDGTGIDGTLISGNGGETYIAKIDGIFRELPQYHSLLIFESSNTPN